MCSAGDGVLLVLLDGQTLVLGFFDDFLCVTLAMLDWVYCASVRVP